MKITLPSLSPILSSRLAFWALPVLLSHAVAAAADENVVYKPLRFGGVHEMGAIQHGLVADESRVLSSETPKLENEWVDHFGAYMEQEVTVDDRLRLQLGLGGVFQFPKPEYVFSKFKSSMYKMFFIGPSIAKATYHFGDPENPRFSLGGGLFPFKYNPEAANLGEYLFRSGPYPAYLMTGGLLFLNDNAAYLQGLHSHLRLGGLHLNAILSTETSIPPLYDWSLGVLADYSVAEGLLKFGAGVNFKRLLQVRPSRTTLKTNAQGDVAWKNIHFNRNGKDYYGDPVYYKAQQEFYGRLGDAAREAENQAILDSLALWLDPANPRYVTEGEREYYTPAGTVIMAHASLDLRKMLGMPEAGAPFKLFTEAALLGWKDYPVFYEDRLRRMPVMAGIHLPTFGLLNQLTVQVEHYDSPWSNSTYNLGEKNLAVPSYPENAATLFSRDGFNDLAKHDNYYWSVLVSRELYPHLNLKAQFARDHLRTVGTGWFYGGRLEPGEILYRNSSWYWMAQLTWGI